MLYQILNRSFIQKASGAVDSGAEIDGFPERAGVAPTVDLRRPLLAALPVCGLGFERRPVPREVDLQTLLCVPFLLLCRVVAG